MKQDYIKTEITQCIEDKPKMSEWQDKLSVLQK